MYLHQKSDKSQARLRSSQVMLRGILVYDIYTIINLLCDNDFSEQYHIKDEVIKDEVLDVRCDEKSISSKTYQQYA
jgi:hypothetical protein